MSEERYEKLTVEEIKQRLRGGCTFYPMQPGLQQAARELIRPIVEKMDGQEIIYVCRVPKLMRVKYLEEEQRTITLSPSKNCWTGILRTS